MPNTAEHSDSTFPIPYSISDPDQPIPYAIDAPVEFCERFVVGDVEVLTAVE